MAKINLLDKSIFNRIAAGEVVEKPASVVKELVENSIDAGATNIVIEIEDGGITKIKVADNGVGMSFEDLPKAFMPHATSKVAKLEDLEAIGTLGFRGEALSSIASVAKLTAITKQSQDEFGSKIEIDGGEVLLHEQTGASDGTTMLIQNLFENVPARAKFLRKPKQEENEITNVVSRLILANPHIVFKYCANNKVIYLSNGNGLKDAIYTVYGKVAVENLIPISYKRDFFKLEGFIGGPNYTKPNRTYQTLMINDRYVINQTVSTAAYKAFEGFLMKGNFPFFVLKLIIPLDKVDVNVHPNKLDVKFEESGKIFGVILHAISDALLKHVHMKKLEEQEQIISMPSAEQITKSDNATQSASQLQNSFNNANFVNNNLANKNENTNQNEDSNENEVNELLNSSNLQNKQENALRNSLSQFLSTENVAHEVRQDYGFAQSMLQGALESAKMYEEVQVNNYENVTLFNDSPHKTIGVVFGTYVIVEQNKTMYVIDQHAAHERILYDKFKEQLQNRQLAVQDLLVPFILDANHQESTFINSNLENFENAGFKIDEFGANSFKVSSTPVVFRDIKLKQFFDEVLKDLNTNLNLSSAGLIEDYLARKACRSAVKANDLLTEYEIDKLLQDLNRQNQVLHCPHGRPIVVNISETEIEKWFKRIV